MQSNSLSRRETFEAILRYLQRMLNDSLASHAGYMTLSDASSHLLRLYSFPFCKADRENHQKKRIEKNESVLFDIVEFIVLFIHKKQRKL